jgi:dethiobiotin synthetase
MTADPPLESDPTPPPAVPPPPREERTGGGHGLPAGPPPAPAAPAPLPPHGGGRALPPLPPESLPPARPPSGPLDTAGPAPRQPSPGQASPGQPSPGQETAADPAGQETAADPAGQETAADPAGPQPSGEETAADPGPPVEEPDDRPAPHRPDHSEWHGIVLVTGTDTEVGKTVATAAMAAAAQAAGLRVAVIKPGQTGIATGEPTDAEVVTRLAGPETVRTLAEYPEPLAPLAAAKVAGLPALDLYDVVDAVRAEAEKHDLVLVEGAGGLLVPMGLRPSGDPWTFADLATTLGSGMIVVTRAGLGTLNHTALTLEALDRRGVPAKVILGAWPAEPELVHWANLGELVPHLVGALPSGAGSMDPGVFRRSAPGWLTPALHGVLDNWRVWAEEAG